MKRKVFKTFIFLLVLGLMFFSVGCGTFSLNGGNINSDDVYQLSAVDVADYTSITVDNIGVTVASIVMPATVEIECKIDYSYTTYGWGPGFGSSSKTTTASATSLATGFFINEDGYMLTNAHVVTLEDYESYPNFAYVGRTITINYADSSQTFSAEIIAYDTDLDLAILKVDSSQIENFRYVTFYNLTDPSSEEYSSSSAVKLLYGEVAIAIGNANGYGISVTQGVVSAPLRYFQNGNVVTQAIQTDAAINSGNSGGPLVNKFATVIGINSFKIVTTTSESLGYAIPANVVLDYVDTVNTDENLTIKYYYTDVRSYETDDIKSNF